MGARPPAQAADSDRHDLDEAREDVELVYRVIGDRALSGPAAVGPWDASMQHGAAPAGLVAWAAEQVASKQPMLVTRMTVGEYPPGTGRQAIWYRLNRAIIEGQSTSPLMRAAATADFTNGTAGLLDPTRWSFINADLSLQLVRQPAGEWILLEAEMWLSSFGSAVANGRLSDRTGVFGRCSQSLVIEPRDQRKD